MATLWCKAQIVTSPTQADNHGWGRTNHTGGQCSSMPALALKKDSSLKVEIHGMNHAEYGMAGDDFRVLVRVGGDVLDDEDASDFPFNMIRVWDTTKTTIIDTMSASTGIGKFGVATSHIQGETMKYYSQDSEPAMPTNTAYWFEIVGDFDEVDIVEYPLWDTANTYNPVECFRGQRTGQNIKMWRADSLLASGAADFDAFYTANSANMTEFQETGTVYQLGDFSGMPLLTNSDLTTINGWTFGFDVFDTPTTGSADILTNNIITYRG